MQDLILQTKLQPPQIRGKILYRERLLSLLKKNLDKKLILICADAGYGKTTLLTQFCSKLDKLFMFYDLDATDNDIATFFNYLVEGIQRHYADFGQRTRTVILQTRNIEIIVGTFINEFIEKCSSVISDAKKESGDFYIILDDYHHLQQNKEIGNALDYLLRHLPHNLHLIISSRSTPPLNLAYYLAKQELFRLEKWHLQFTIKEIQELLNEIYGLKIPKTEIELIEKHSEGWITAIQLILQRISTSGEIHNFLIKTSILAEMDKESCNYLLKIKDADRMLKNLESEHIFITKINNNFYRYHPLFREFLNNRLKISLSSRQINWLYQRAGQYFRKKGDYLNAIKYFLNGEHYDRAAKILTKNQFIMQSESIYTSVQLINQLPLSIVDKYPRLLMAKSKYLSYLGKWDDALRLAMRAKQIFQKHKDASGLNEILLQIGFIHLLRLQPLKALHWVKKAYLLVNRRNYLLMARIMVLLGSIYRALARYDDGENFLSNALTIAQRLNNQGLKLEALKGLARIYAERTNFQAALSVFAEIFVMYENRVPGLTYASLCTNAASLYIEIHNFNRAKELLKRAEKFAHLYNDRRTLIYLKGIWGKFHLYSGEYLIALEHYEEVLALNKGLGEKLIELYARIDIVYVNIALKKISTAKLLLSDVDKLISTQTPYPILIDLYIAKGQLNKIEKKFNLAEENFCHALRLATKSGLKYYEMKIYYFLAQIYLGKGNIEQFTYNLIRCFEIAQVQGYDFFLTKEAMENSELFKKAMETDINSGYLLRILEKIETPEIKQLLTDVEKAIGEYDFEIRLFGQLEIKNRQGATISVHWKTQKTKALFVYLIINQGRLIQKDRLRDIFWPGKNLTKATHSLYDHIFFARNIFKNLLGKDARGREIIRFCNPFYQLTYNIHLKIDVCQFESLIKKAIGLEATNIEKAMKLYKEALELYRGDFCPELYENWAEEKRLFYRTEILRLIKKLAGYYYDNKKYQKSLELYRSGLNYDRLDKAIHIGIMRCLGNLGDKIGVKRQYQELEKILKKELNTIPDKQTQQVYHRLMNQ